MNPHTITLRHGLTLDQLLELALEYISDPQAAESFEAFLTQNRDHFSTPQGETANMVIPAEVHSDDHAVQAPFDAEPWFEHASDEDLIRLAEENWGHGYAADAVAEYMRNRNADVTYLFKYLDVVHHKQPAIGFECSVDTTAAEAWIAKHRPHLSEKIDDLP